MVATLNVDPIYGDRWLVSESDGQAPKLGLQVGGETGSELTVCWSGDVQRADMWPIIGRVAKMLAAGFVAPHGKFVAYGKDMRAEFKIEDGQIKPPDQSLLSKLWPLAKNPLDTFDACRAEVTGSQGTVVVWANVTGHTRGGLDKGGENIGVSVPIILFADAAQSVITYAIEQTTDMRENAVSNLLATFSQSLLTLERIGRVLCNHER